MRDYTAAVFARVKATASLDGIPVTGPSFTSLEAYRDMGGMDDIIDAPRVHLYQSNRHPGTAGWGDNGYGSTNFESCRHGTWVTMWGSGNDVCIL